MANCQLCQSAEFINNIDFGDQPVSHRFSNNENEDNYKHQIKMGQCKDCGLVQITTPFPVKELVPRFDWLTCTEPEGHLDRLVEKLTKLDGIGTQSKILGLTFKEDSTLDRFNKLGYPNTYRFDIQKDFLITNPLANVESAVDGFNAEFAKRFEQVYGKADIFICRHVIEHSINILEFIEAIKILTHENSYIVIEIPECGAAFELCDYTTVWEEHNLYFTPELFKSFLINSGLNIHTYIQEPYPLEDACIAIAQKSLKPIKIAPQHSHFENFVQSFSNKKIEVRERLIEFKKDGKVALFGAGHMSVAFVNLMEVEDLIDYVIDDNVHKSQYFLPGTQIAIHSSEALITNNISHCLLSLAPESEVKVVQKNSNFVELGGKFLSIFSKNSSYFLK